MSFFRNKLCSPARYILLLPLLSLFTGCLSGERRSQTKEFDWDTDLAPLETKPQEGWGSWNKGSDYDKNFCKGLRPGTCFSLVIRVPKPALIQDLGLSVLALGSSSRTLRTRMDEACQAAWSDYRQKYLYDNLRPLRRDFVRRVEKMRCVYHFMDEEVAMENLRLSPQDIALSVRLTRFELIADEIGAVARNFGFTLQTRAVHTEFRSLSLYGSSTAAPAWVLGEGLGVAPLKSQGPLERKVQWKLDYAALQKNLQSVAEDPAGSQKAFSSFLTQAKNQLATLSAASQTPLSGAVLLLGMGYNAFRNLCGESREFCEFRSQRSTGTANLEADLADLVPSSETNELFRLALIRSTQSILDESLTKLSPSQVKTVFAIP